MGRNCDLENSLDRLWVAAAWNTPWKTAQNLDLGATYEYIEPDLALACRIGMSGMRTLPPEIWQLIHGYSPSSPFWRYSVARHLALRLSSAPSDNLVSMPLSRVSAWERGGERVVTGARLGGDEVLRLTMDARGLVKIERLPEHPELEGWRYDHLAFALVKRSSCAYITAFFRVSK